MFPASPNVNKAFRYCNSSACGLPFLEFFLDGARHQTPVVPRVSTSELCGLASARARLVFDFDG